MDPSKPPTQISFERSQRRQFQSKKLYSLCGLVTLSSGFLWTKRMKAEEWINFNKWIFGIYGAGNVSAKATEAYKQKDCSGQMLMQPNYHGMVEDHRNQFTSGMLAQNLIK